LDGNWKRTKILVKGEAAKRFQGGQKGGKEEGEKGSNEAHVDDNGDAREQALFFIIMTCTDHKLQLASQELIVREEKLGNT
jgi:hypothetical protein